MLKNKPTTHKTIHIKQHKRKRKKRLPKDTPIIKILSFTCVNSIVTQNSNRITQYQPAKYETTLYIISIFYSNIIK